MKKKIAIIGSGIAGLTLASLLKTNSNFEFLVYEKGETLNLDEGFGIQLSVNSVFILNKIGFNQLDKNEKYHPSKLDFYSINCNKICDLNLTTFNSKNDEYTTLKRSILVRFLKERLLSNSIIFHKKINNVEQINGKINIHFIDGSSDKVDYLVVSDGVFSNTKSVIEKNFFKPFYNSGIPGFIGGLILGIGFAAYIFSMYTTTVANTNFIITTETIFLAAFGYFLLLITTKK